MAVVTEREVLRSFLIPFQGGQILLPNSSVVEVLPFGTPLKLENAPSWVVGSILWRSLNAPLVSMARLLDPALPEGAESHARIIMINALGDDTELSNFGFLGTDPPRPLNLERIDIAPDENAGTVFFGVASRVFVNGQAAVIPDLDAIEAVVGPLMRRA